MEQSARLTPWTCLDCTIPLWHTSRLREDASNEYVLDHTELPLAGFDVQCRFDLGFIFPLSPLNAEAAMFAGILCFFSCVLLSDPAQLALGKAFALPVRGTRLLLSAPALPPARFSFRPADREQEGSAALQRLRREEAQQRVRPHRQSSAPAHRGFGDSRWPLSPFSTWTLETDLQRLVFLKILITKAPLPHHALGRKRWSVSMHMGCLGLVFPFCLEWEKTMCCCCYPSL